MNARNTLTLHRDAIRELALTLADLDRLLRDPQLNTALRPAAQSTGVDLNLVIDMVGFHALRLQQILHASPRRGRRSRRSTTLGPTRHTDRASTPEFDAEDP